MTLEYEMVGSYAPSEENVVEQAVVRLKTIKEGSKILNANGLGSAERLVVIIGIYNGFYSCFEIIMQANKKSDARIALERWKVTFSTEKADLDDRYRSFRNLMTHQGHYIAGSQLHWEVDDLNDTHRPVRSFPPFINKKLNGNIIKQYTASEWIEECYDAIYSSLNRIEGIRQCVIKEKEK